MANLLRVLRGGEFFAAVTVAAAAFVLYHATLLPSFDFGDTGFLQFTVLSPSLTPRDGYPLYFAIGKLFVWLTHAEPARALNLASAVEGAAACGLAVLVASELSGSLVAAVGASLLFAVSYTFWSQAIIAEVYALHALFAALTLWLLLRWAGRPTRPRLALFFAVFALGFGNHLSMVLLAPGYACFLLLAAPDGWRSMLRPRIVALAAAIALAGALQYLWNLRGLWLWPRQPPGLADALRTFWFDVTKADWRETLVWHVPASMVRERIAMYVFDVHQQFGWAVLLAPLGLARLLLSSWRRGALMLALYLANALFAFTYSVGDTHVFYLPSHLILALLVAPGIVAAGRRPLGVAIASLVVIASGAARMYADYPALDRSHDRRPTEVLARLTQGLDDRHAILLADLNWQLVNGLAYFGKVTKPDLAYEWTSRVLLYAPALVRDNLDNGRQVALTSRADALLTRAYGPLLPTAPDPRVRTDAVADLVRDLPSGTRYALCVLAPSPEFRIDERDLARAVSALTGGRRSMPAGDYAALAGVVGQPPALEVGAAEPFRQRAEIDRVAVDVRMESWLTFDTIRRMGFGQVVSAHRHALIVERGVSFAAFDAEGRPFRIGYAANIFEPQPRYVVLSLKIP